MLDHDHKNERKRGRTYISEGRRERHGQVEEPDHHLTNDEQISHIAASVMEHSDRSIDSRRAGDASENQKTDVHGGEEGESKGDGVQVLDPSDTGDSMRASSLAVLSLALPLCRERYCSTIPQIHSRKSG